MHVEIELRQRQLTNEASNMPFLWDGDDYAQNINLDSLKKLSCDLKVKSIVIDILYIRSIKENDEELFNQLLAQHPLNNINMTIYDHLFNRNSLFREYAAHTLLSWTARNGRLAMARTLIEKCGANVNAYSKSRSIPLLDCVMADKKNLTKELNLQNSYLNMELIVMLPDVIFYQKKK